MKKLIATPYGRKTPELLCKAMDAYELQPELLAALEAAEGVIDWALDNDAHPGVRAVHRMVLDALTEARRIAQRHENETQN